MASLGGAGDVIGSTSLSNGRDELKSQFTTREGTYRLVSAVELARNTRPISYPGAATGPANNSGSLPALRLSFITLTSTSCSGGAIENGIDHSSGEESYERNSSNILYHSNHRICVNIGKELFVYPYLGCRKSVDLTKAVDKRVYKGTNPTFHDFSEDSASQDSLLLLVGFTGGQIQLVDPITKEINKLFNEERMIDKSRVTCVRWIPNSSSKFLVSHSSGHMYLYNVDSSCVNGTVSHFQVAKSGPGYTVSHAKGKIQRNPLTRWSLSDGAINEFAFSPCGEYLAVVSQDGFLRIFKYDNYELFGLTRSYFGGLLCVSWSPDGKYICVGGEDDLVTLWSFKERRVVARGQGHKSWVSVVAFDPFTTTYGDFEVTEKSGTSGIVASRRESSSSGVFSDVSQIKANHTSHSHMNNVNSSSSIAPTSSSITNHSFSNQSHEPFSNSSVSNNVHNGIVFSNLRVSQTSESMRLSVSEARTQTCYRVGSVGQDTQLCLWDLTEDVLKQPFGKSPRIAVPNHHNHVGSGGNNSVSVNTGPTSTGLSSHSNHSSSNCTDANPSVTCNNNNNHRNSGSNSSGGSTNVSGGMSGILSLKFPFSREHKRNNSSGSNKNQISGGSGGNNVNGADVTENPMKLIGTQSCPRLDECPLLEPLICKKISHERLTSLIFREESILTLCQDGILCTWARPGDLGSQL